MVTEGLPRHDVAQVHFDERPAHTDQSVTKRDARVAVSSGVDDETIDAWPEPLDLVDQRALTVRLKTNQIHLEAARGFRQPRIELRKCLAAVDLRLAAAQ